jgi:hypothetical protein
MLSVYLSAFLPEQPAAAVIISAQIKKTWNLRIFLHAFRFIAF